MQPRLRKAPHHIAFVAVAHAARHRARMQHDELAAFQPPHQIDILHQRHRFEAAELAIKLARDEQALIAVRQREQEAAERHERFQHARHDAVIIERKAEGSGSRISPPIRHPLHEPFRLFRPARLEDGVGMEEEQPVSARRGGAGLKLRAASKLRPDKAGSGSLGDGTSLVARPAIDQDRLLHDAVDHGRNERGERRPQRGLCVESGDNHGNHGAGL